MYQEDHLRLTHQTSCEITLHKQNNFSRGAYRPNPTSIDQVKLILHQNQQEISNQDALFIYDTFKEDEIIRHLCEVTDALAKQDQFIFLFQNAKLIHYPKGSVIFKEGDKQDGKFYFLLSGQVTLAKRDKDSLLNASLTSEQHPFIPIEMIEPYSPSEHYHKNYRETPKSVLNYQNRKSSFLVNMLERNSPKTSTGKSSGNLGFGNKFWQGYKKPAATKPGLMAVADAATAAHKLKERRGFLQQASSNEKFHGINSDRKKYRKSDTVDGIISPHGNLLDRVHEGGHFGEDAFEKKGKRLMTAVATLNTDVMELDKKHIEEFIEAFTEKKEKMIEFLIKVLPAIDSRYAVVALENLLFSLERKEANFNDFFVKEGEVSDNVYILFEGTCQLSKTVVFNDAEKMKQPLEGCKNIYGLKQSSVENINICNLDKGAFIGEEVLFNKSKQYEYNVQVTSSRAVFLTLSKWKFSILPLGVNKGVRKLYEEKRAKNMRIFKTILETKRLKYKEEQLEEIGPLIVSSKEKLSYRPNLHSKSPSSKNREFLVIEDFIRNVNNESNDTLLSENHEVKKQKNIQTGKIEVEGFSLEKFIYDLHRYKDKKPADDDEDTVTGEKTLMTIEKSLKSLEKTQEFPLESTTAAILLEDTIREEDQDILLPKIEPSKKIIRNGFLATHQAQKNAEQTEETLSKTIYSMLKHNTRDGSPQGEISLRLASHPCIMKVDQCYKIMKNIIKQDVVSRSNETDPIKQNNILGFVPDDFELETYRKKRNQKQKQIMLNRCLDKIKFLSPKRQHENPQTSQVLLSTVAEQRYLKSRFKKRKKFPSFATLYQKSVSNTSANGTAPTTPMSRALSKENPPACLIIPPNNMTINTSLVQPPSPHSQIISPTSLMISPSSPTGNTFPTSPGITNANTPNLASALTAQTSAPLLVAKFTPVSPKHRRPHSGSIMMENTGRRFTHRPSSSFTLNPMRPTMDTLPDNTVLKSPTRPTSSYVLSPKRKVSMPENNIANAMSFKFSSRPSSSYLHSGTIRPLSGISILTEGHGFQIGGSTTGPTNESRGEIPEIIEPQTQTQKKSDVKKIGVGELFNGNIHKNNHHVPQPPVRRKGSIPKRVGGFTSKSFLNIKNNESVNNV